MTERGYDFRLFAIVWPSVRRMTFYWVKTCCMNSPRKVLAMCYASFSYSFKKKWDEQEREPIKYIRQYVTISCPLLIQLVQSAWDRKQYLGCCIVCVAGESVTKCEFLYILSFIFFHAFSHPLLYHQFFGKMYAKLKFVLYFKWASSAVLLYYYYYHSLLLLLFVVVNDNDGSFVHANIRRST